MQPPEKVPDAIAPVRTLPPYWADLLLPYLEAVNGRLAAVVTFDQSGNGLVFDWGCSVGTYYDAPFTSTLPPTDATRLSFHEDIVGGDSGMPCCAIVNSEPLLLFLTGRKGWGGGYPIFDDHDTINSMMAQLDAVYWPDEEPATLQYPDMVEYLPLARLAPRRQSAAVAAIGRGA